MKLENFVNSSVELITTIDNLVTTTDYEINDLNDTNLFNTSPFNTEKTNTVITKRNDEIFTTTEKNENVQTITVTPINMNLQSTMATVIVTPDKIPIYTTPKFETTSMNVEQVTAEYIARFASRIPILPFDGVRTSSNRPSIHRPNPVYIPESTTSMSSSTNTIHSTTYPNPSSNDDDEITNSTPLPSISSIRDYVVYGILPNNTVVEKRLKYDNTPSTTENGLIVYGIYPNNTVVRKYPNGTIVLDEIFGKTQVTNLSPHNLTEHLKEQERQAIRERKKILQAHTMHGIKTQSPNITTTNTVLKEFNFFLHEFHFLYINFRFYCFIN